MKKIFLYTLSTVLIWGVAGCKKPSDFGNTNVDPSATTVPIPSALLTNVELTLPLYASTQLEAINGAQYSQYFAETQYPAVSLYSLPQYAFIGEYSGILYDLQNIINLNPSNNMVAAATVLQQYIFWHITDAWGDVPYSQALKGLAYTNPAYDTQQSIYTSMLASLTAAEAKFDGSALSGDVIYGGDVSKWKKFTNSLRMLISLQMSKKMPTSSDFAATQFKAALADAGGSITTNTDNFALTYPSGTYKDPLFNLYDGRTDYAESKTMTDLLGSLSDARATVYGGAFNDPNNVSGGTVSSNVGIPPGGDRTSTVIFTTANPNWAMVLRADKRTPTSTLTMISASESLLARAHAVALGWTTETYATTYQAGIVQSFEQWGLADPSVTYMTNVNASGAAVPTFQQIIQQRYLASYPDGFMGWDIYRLTTTTRDGGTTGTAFANNPLGIKPGTGATNNPKLIVSRFTYTAAEYSTNGVNASAAAARYTGGDKQDSRVWWDQ
ncbi:hypothetical protein BEL04_11405 [Mucilaginibacter sp. PPCGB 2223]|uniref:SusD/RagB family nutrient-binding outer membrane lipoprotein n=1 Tax=Mucilaginibacter sp. PPCGB 2223 TaxID=1886027 RepID=UPI0008271083|nr:SusD/RagB family nutrient-binding outer membrane lipoprotein [Mucilaginibacter sp. PPCGB 2223]OCX52098.1 hypothetical protein BEL04_11405 [Mucilaginibacter sp. PPCGB 2223]